MEKDNNIVLSPDSPNRYIRMAAKFKSWPLIERFFPNQKEITESFCAWHHINQMKGIRRNNTIFIVVGDGIYPRTSSIFALRTPFPVVCIDPILRETHYPEIQRLELIKEKVEIVSIISVLDWDQAIIVLVHSHAKIENCLHLVPNAKRLVVFTLPCCVSHELKFSSFNLNIQPTYNRIDNHVLSPCRNVLIWDIHNWHHISRILTSV